MTEEAIRSPLTTGSTRIKNRDPSRRDTDIAFARAIAQAAVDVELFTIPLYMSAMYSIYGSHQINAKDQKFYDGRLWPGLATTAAPKTANEQAFNLIFSVFIEEMLHLQMAANLAVTIGARPRFTGGALQDENFGWKCYSGSVIPHIIDLKHTKSYCNVTVDFKPLSLAAVDLFLAIEQPDNKARKDVKKEASDKYFHEPPFNDWKPGQALPMFGSIGWMYQCFADYLRIEYKDGSTLWQSLAVAFQRDLFNYKGARSHPKKEYPNFDAMVPPDKDSLEQAIEMIKAITDQGEGSLVKMRNKGHDEDDEDEDEDEDALTQEDNELLKDVARKYSPDVKALALDYPSFTSTGVTAPSRDAAARDQHAPWTWRKELDHYLRFKELKKIVSKTKGISWKDHEQDAWMPGFFGSNTGNTSNKIPTPDELVEAFKKLTTDTENKRLLNAACVGAIAGITRVLDDYWTNPTTAFPGPSMVGSGDRMSIYWAVYRHAPDLSKGLQKPSRVTVGHACQGLDWDGSGTNNCGEIGVFHTCRGSNACKGEGGCGFVQSKDGGGSCGFGSSARFKPVFELNDETTLYSAPSDNRCGGFGGCAVPISASQLFPNSGTMQLYKLDATKSSEEAGIISFKLGESVWEKAWEAYTTVKYRDKNEAPERPAANALRKILPPST